MRMLNAALLCLMFLTLFSCATSRKDGLTGQANLTSISEAEFKKAIDAAEKLWLKRHERASLEEAIQEMEKVANTTQAGTLLFTRLTRAYYLLGDAHEQDMDKKKAYWEKGAAYGERAMAMNPAFRKAVIDEKQPAADHLDKLTVDESPAMYWTAANLGKWSRATGIAATLKNKPLITGLIKAVEKTNPKYFYGAIPRYWGGFYAVAPGFAGGDMKKSWSKFDESLKEGPHYLGTKVLIAELWYVKQGEKAKFEKILKEVLAADVKVVPDLMPENVLEQKKAEKLLSQMNDLF